MDFQTFGDFMQVMKSLALAAALALGCVSSVGAQISNESIAQYNEAQKSKDLLALAAAARALVAESVSHSGDPQAAVIAFETAWTLVRLGHAADAQPAIDLLSRLPADGEHPSKEDRELLSSFFDWKLEDSVETRRRLDARLEDMSDEKPSLLAVTAYRERYLSAYHARRWREAKQLASAATEHSEPERWKFLSFWSLSRLTELTAEFNARPRLRTLYALTHLEGQLSVDYVSFPEAEPPDWFIHVYYTVEAWRRTMQAYFASVRERSLRQSDRRVEEIRSGYRDKAELREEPAKKLDVPDLPPLCEGELSNEPRMKYPPGARRSGKYGAVILLLSLDEGKVSDAEVLASVPDPGFKEEALETVRKWRYVAAADAEQPCTLSVDQAIVPVIFSLR